jgi:hypothetical protein
LIILWIPAFAGMTGMEIALPALAGMNSESLVVMIPNRKARKIKRIGILENLPFYKWINVISFARSLHSASPRSG